uniref:Structural maintenance of chromosomes protein n=1 Tax=Strongyloides stercoralis TaxID=6248 RepID=A0A0K0EN19_STRER
MELDESFDVVASLSQDSHNNNNIELPSPSDGVFYSLTTTGRSIQIDMQNFNIKQIEDINLEEYSEFLNLEIPPKTIEIVKANGLEGRLVIDTIILENFKSYYGVKKIGPLSMGLSCIIGPNGSGKSNIFDCMLFVFDYNVRKCRAKKATEFIHKSSREVCTFARVTINFKRIKGDGANYVDIDDSAFSIAREVTINNKTTFYFNGSAINRNELKGILKSHGLGLDHDRFLILQGEVESISLLKPKAEKEEEDSLLSLLDDIIGTSRFQKPLERINEAISQIQFKVSTMNSRVRDCEKVKSLLDEKVRKSIERMRIKNILVDLKLQKYLVFMSKNEKASQNLEERIQGYREDISKLSHEISKLENEIEFIEKDQSGAKEEASQLHKEICKIRETLNRNEVKLEEICREIPILENSLRKKEQKNEELHKELIVLQNAPLEISKEKEVMEKKLIEYDKLEIEYGKKKKEVEDAFEVERSKWSSEFDLKQGDVVELQSEINNLINEKKKHEISMSQVTSQRTNKLKEIEDLRCSIKLLSSTNTTNLEKKEELMMKVNETEGEISGLKEESMVYESKIKKLQEDIHLKTLDYGELSKKYESIVSQEKILPSSEVHRYLNTLNYPGFRGRLGDLASIDKRYDVALSTLGGGSLNMFVVDEVKGAQYLVEQLKRSKTGRGTFICIDEMKKRFKGRSGVGRSPPGTVRAIDLLQNVSADVLVCFENVFRDSLVVDSIDSASQFTKNANGYMPKIVTLDGNVFESSGKITGGGKAISGLIGEKNYSNPSVDKDLKADLKRKIYNLNDEIKNLKMANVDLMDKKAKIDSEIRKKRVFLEDTIKIQQRNIEITISNAERLLKVKKDTLIDMEKDLSNIEVDENTYNNICMKVSTLESQIVRKQQKLSKKEEQFNEIKSKVDNIYKSVVGNCSIDYENCLKDKKACQDNIKALERKFVLSSKSYRQKVSERDANEEGIQEIREKYEYLHGQENFINENTSKLVDKLNELSRKLEEVNERINRQNDLHSKKMMVIDLKNERSRKDYVLRDGERDLAHCLEMKVSYNKKMKNLKYTFYNSMNLLPPELISYRNDEQFYSKRVDDAEKEFMNSLDNIDHSKSSPIVEVSLKEYSEEEIQNIINHEDKIFTEINTLSSHCDEPPDNDAISIYLDKQEVYLSNLSIYKKINKFYKTLKNKSSNWTRQRIQEFNIGFRSIAKSVKEVYQNLTLGGDAELEYCDTFDPYNFGIYYKVRPPNKSWRKLHNLSGGEKTLASLALIFGLHEYNPTPLYIMDEIDAALDFRNVAVIGRYIQKKTSNAQFIVVSLRKEMYELADKCICIWKVKDGTATGSSDVKKIKLEIESWNDLRDIITNTNIKKNLKSLCHLLSDCK